MNRRTALKALTALPLIGSAAAASERLAPHSQPPSAAGFGLGIATVSLKSLPLESMLAAVKRVGVDSISLHRAHSPWENPPGKWTEIAGAIRAAGITPRCCGVLNLKNEESAMRRMMDYVKAHGLNFFSCSLPRDALPLLQKLVIEYDFTAAIHNHGPEDKVWPGAKSVWEGVQDCDARIGLCLDIGHSWRAGEDPAEVVRTCAGRLYDVHFKDSIAAIGQEDVPVEMGRGKIDLRGILQALVSVGYARNVWLEYEKDANDPVPGLAESAGYVRGLMVSSL